MIRASGNARDAVSESQGGQSFPVEGGWWFVALGVVLSKSLAAAFGGGPDGLER
jgi:hypothetical protein